MAEERKLRVAQVTNLMESVPPLYQHGLEQVVHCLTEELVRMGMDVTLYATADSKTAAKLEAVWPKATMRDVNSKLWSPNSFSVWSVAAAYADWKKFDIIHNHDRFVADQFAGLIDTPVVTTLHHPVDFEVWIERQYPEEYQPYFKKYWHSHQTKAHVVTVSRFQAREFEKIYGYYPQVIHNGIDLPEYHETKGQEYTAFLGYITANKGVAEAIQAVLPTREKLIIAGPLDDTEVNQNYFKTRVEPFVDGEKIKYIGPVAGQEKWNFLAGAKAILMPSQWDEPFGLVAVESLAVGTPVIGMNRGAMPEIVVDGSTGFVVQNTAEMTKKITEIKHIKRLSCRQRTEENFSAQIMAEKYVEFYRSLI